MPPSGRSHDGDAGHRDPALWPFATTSPWNTPLGTAATYATDDDPRVVALRTAPVDPWVNAGRYSHPVFRARADDEVADVTIDGCVTTRFRAPADVQPASGDDAHLHVIDPTAHWVDELFQASGQAPHLKAAYHVRVDLLGSGIDGGTRAYGGSAIAGLMRRWELRARSIRHVLAMGLSAQQLGHEPVWPASREDGDAAASYGGSVPMGSLVALPSSVDIETLGLDDDGLMLARALQDFGAYVVDRAECTCIYAEPSLERDPRLAHLRQAMATLRPLLTVVTDNGPDRPGGHGDRRAPEAPPLG